VADVAENGPYAVIAVAASAGGVEALAQFVSELPADLPAAVLIVLHIPPTAPSVLPVILARAGKLPARHPDHDEPLVAGTILAAPPDRHMAVTGSRVQLLAGPRENGQRPAADVLFRSVAEVFGNRAAGVVLSGTMDDGAAGLRAVAVAGGLTLVQDPEEAAFPGMPLAAIRDANPMIIDSVSELAGHLCRWLASLTETVPETAMAAHQDPAGARGRGGASLYASQASTGQQGSRAAADGPGGLTEFTCPECGGTLWHRHDYGAERFRCRVGHSFSAIELLLGKQGAVESALWAAIVALQERADLARRVAARLERSGSVTRSERYRAEIDVAEQRIKVLRDLIRDLLQRTSMTYDDEADIDDSTT
jgi:two-component system, chemotaxis family, protein-glutamate methylesterase/glutaminase